MKLEAIILAAGMSERFRKISCEPKVIVKVNSMPLIAYPITSLKITGVDRMLIVVNAENKCMIENIIKKYFNDLDVRFVINDEISRENGYSLYLGFKHVESDKFFVSMADHVYPPRVLQKILERDKLGDGDIIIAGDKEPLYVDVEEATLIESHNHKVLRVAKGLTSWSYVDAGVFLMKKSIFKLLCEVVKDNYIVKLSDILNSAVRKGYRVLVADITGIPWTELDLPKDYYSILHGIRKRVVEEVVEEWERLLGNVRTAQFHAI